MNKFDNTYINVSGKSPDEIYELAKKYSEVSGIGINSEDIRNDCFDLQWKYLCCASSGIDYECEGVYVNDYTNDLPNNPKQITEEDLDKSLKQQEQSIKTLPEEFIITNADSLAVRKWLKDLGYTWASGGNLTNHILEEDVIAYMIEDGGFTKSPLEYYKEKYPNLPIITPKIGVTGFDITYPTPEKSVKEIEIENMKKQIFEMQESLKKLESEG